MFHAKLPQYLFLMICAVLLSMGQLLAAENTTPLVDKFGDYPPDSLLEATGGALTTRQEGGERIYRWQLNTGENSSLALRTDSPVFNRLRYFDRLHLEFRVVSGDISSLGARAMGQVSGVRQSKAYSWNLGNRTVEQNVWHIREVELANPYWLPWDNTDGEGDRGLFPAGIAGVVTEYRDRAAGPALFTRPGDVEAG